MKILENKKFLYIIVGVIIVIIAYYIFTKEDSYIEKDLNVNINNENEKQNEIKNKIKVYITGAVKNQGVYEVEEQSRIADVIKIAGGITESASIEDINLAYIVEDGIKICIPNKGENITNDNTETYITKENNSLENQEKSSNPKSNKININTATQTELEKLPGIGPATALKIIEYRKENGKFKEIGDIKDVKGIGDNKFLKIKEYIKV